MAGIITPAFLASSALIIMVPGPDLAFITRKVVLHGYPAAFAAIAGMISAGALQAAAGLAGTALLTGAVPGALTGLRWAGAGMLAGFGLLAIRSALSSPAVRRRQGADRPGRAYWQGMACTGANPKVGVFLLAYLPQFVPAGTPPSRAMAWLAAAYLTMGMIWLVVWTVLAHQARRRLLTPRMVRGTELLVGAVLMVFAARLALGSP